MRISLAIVIVAATMMLAAVTLTQRPTLPRGLPFALISSVATPSRVTATYAIDTVAIAPGGRDLPFPGAEHPAVRVPRNRGLWIAGWAFDAASKRPSSGVLVTIDGAASFRAAYGDRRPDVAASFGEPRLISTGFTASIPPGILAAGRHRVGLIVVTADGSGYYRIDDRLELDQEP